MAWRIELSNSAEASLSRLDSTIQQRIGQFFDRLVTHPNPRSLGKALTGPLGVYWSYRVGVYRVLCDIHDNVLVVEVIRIGHRREVYRIV